MLPSSGPCGRKKPLLSTQFFCIHGNCVSHIIIVKLSGELLAVRAIFVPCFQSFLSAADVLVSSNKTDIAAN